LTINVIAIEETDNLINDIGKFTKKSKIINVNLPGKSREEIGNRINLRYFNSEEIQKQVKELCQIKSKFDICIVSSWNAAKLAYLADLNYIMFFIGNDIRIPPFIKDSKPKYFENPVNRLNFFQRRFYKKVFENATICVTGSQELFLLLKKLRKDSKRIDRFVIDTTIFKSDVKPNNFEKKKFSFFCPQRIGVEKGTNVLWDAIKLTKSDFEVLQVNWFDQKTSEIENQSLDLIRSKPEKIKLINKIERKDMPKYYSSVDAILGDMQSGHLNFTECEAVLCGKPVLCYNDPNCKYLINNKENLSPFISKNKDPEQLAELIDKLVTDNNFKNNLHEEEKEFVEEIADPHKAAKEWEEIFEIQNKNWNFKQKKDKWLRKKIKMLSYKIVFSGKCSDKTH